MRTYTEYRKEIEQIKTALSQTNSEYLKKDLIKYIKRLERAAKKSIQRGWEK